MNEIENSFHDQVEKFPSKREIDKTINQIQIDINAGDLPGITLKNIMDKLKQIEIIISDHSENKK